MPAVPRSMSGLRPHLSTVAMAISVKSTQAPLMMICCKQAGVHAGRGAHGLEDRRAEVDEDIDAGDLLENGQRNAQEQRPPQLARRKARPRLPCSCEMRGFDAGALRRGESGAADLSESSAARSSRRRLDQPARAFRNRNQQQAEEHRGRDARGEHPAPAGVDEPGLVLRCAGSPLAWAMK